MYTIEFYENAHGKSELWDFLELLRTKAKTSKDARIQYNQIVLYIQLLQDNGTRLPKDVTKHIEDGIWELRPGNNRIFYFFFENNTFVLLHQFRKKTQKTPPTTQTTPKPPQTPTTNPPQKPKNRGANTRPHATDRPRFLSRRLAITATSTGMSAMHIPANGAPAF